MAHGQSPPTAGTTPAETPREAGGHIIQHYAKLGARPPLLRRLRNHLVFYFRQGGDLSTLERKVFTENMDLQKLLTFIEQSASGRARQGGFGAGIQGATREPAKVKCQYCGTSVDATKARCSSCGAMIPQA
jgi:hypothetical protein